MVIDTFIFNLIDFVYTNQIREIKSYKIENDGYEIQPFPKYEAWEIFRNFKNDLASKNTHREFLLIDYLNDSLRKENYKYAAALRRELIRTWSLEVHDLHDHGTTLLKKFEKGCRSKKFENFNYLKPTAEMLLFNWEVSFPEVTILNQAISDIQSELKLVPSCMVREDIGKVINHNIEYHPVLQIDLLKFYFSLFKEEQF